MTKIVKDKEKESEQKEGKLFRSLDSSSNSPSIKSSNSSSRKSSKSSSSNSSKSWADQIIQKKLCEDTNPLKSIKEDFLEGNPNLSEETCYYMTIKYEFNEYYSSTAINKDLSLIKEKIKKIKQEFDGSKSISIDCH